MAILSNDELLAIQQAAMEVGLGWRRMELLADLHEAFAQTLMTMPSPAAQLLSDLVTLNNVYRLSDGSVPLKAWLSRAEKLAGPGAAGETFQAMRMRVQEWENAYQSGL